MAKPNGFKMDFVSSAILDDKTKDDRIKFILSRVKDGSILVTNGVLTSEEEMELIKETMRRVDDGLPGIEVASIKKDMKGIQLVAEKLVENKDRIQNFVSGIFGKDAEKASVKDGITLIGPTKIIRKIKKNPDSFSVFTGV